MSQNTKPLDLDFLVGKELLQVCVGLHQSVLNFEGDTALSLESRFLVSSRQGGSSDGERSDQDGQALLKLLGARITRVCARDGELTVAFSNDHELLVHKNKSEYESYQITSPTQTIVV